MATSRLSRLEEKKAKKRITVALVGTVAIVVFMLVFGFRLLIGFSVLVDKLHGQGPASQPEQSVVLPPVLNPLPEATNSATLKITGKGQPNTELVLFVNDTEYKRYPVPQSGEFSLLDVVIKEDSVSIYGQLVDTKTNTTSENSNTITTRIDKTAPKLEISKPDDNSTVNDGTHRVTVEGKTDPGDRVTISGRIVIVRSDGSFTYQMPIADGPNTLEIVARNSGGNETKMTRTVTYQP